MLSVSVAFVIRHAMRMRHIVIRSVAGCTKFFLTFSHKRHDFIKKVIEYKMCISIFCANFA